MNLKFKHFSLPTIAVDANIPEDLKLELPLINNQLVPELQHFLLSIPWEEKYLGNVPQDFRSFFNHVLPYLHVRTTDVHTAICMGFLDEALTAHTLEPVNRLVLGLSLILHDCGWSKLSETEIAQSLGVTGLILSKEAIGPKEKHAIEGKNLAQHLLETFTFNPPLNINETNIILSAVRYHDQPELVAGQGTFPPEVKLLVDLDHLWSFTRKNFWQDTLRKRVSPEDYINNLTNDLPEYFVTDWGRAKAIELLQERTKEVGSLNN